MSSEDFPRPEQLIITGDAFRTADPATLLALYELIGEANFDMEFVYPTVDTPLYKEHFIEHAHEASQTPIVFAGRVWSALTGGGRILEIVCNARDRLQATPPREQKIFAELPDWWKDLCFDAESISWQGLKKLHEQELYSQLHQPFGKKSIDLVAKVIENHRPE